MQQLETVKGKTVIVPNIVKRYTIVSYGYSGWNIAINHIYTTPEDAIQAYFSWQEGIKEGKYKDKYFKVFEMELEIPFVPKDDI